MIKKEDVVSIQKKWSDGLLEIVNQHQNNLDFASCASEFIDRLYDYQNTEVLFKPTLANEIQFRNSKDAALSYFIGNNSKFPSDNGFGIKFWRKVKSETSSIFINENIAMWMGWVTLTDKDGGIIKVDKSWGYKKATDGTLKIILHHSSLPYEA